MSLPIAKPTSSRSHGARGTPPDQPAETSPQTGIDPPSPLFKEPVRIARPAVADTAEMLPEFAAVLRGPQLTNGPRVADLEAEAARFLGVSECVAVSSCTSGLMLTERCLRVRGGVIIPSFTFFAAAHTLLWNNLEPVFADCEPWTFNLNPEEVERLMSPGIGAILGVHTFGCPTQVDALERIARRYRVPLIFDGAHAFGARVDGRGVAEWGDATVFSLSPTKPLTAGEGGLIAVQDPSLASRLRKARNYGKGDGYDCDVLGMNARLTELQAVVARAGLRRVEAVLAKRRALAATYNRCFRGVPGLTTQLVPSGCLSTYKDFSLLIDAPRFGRDRREIETILAVDNIETRRYFDPPLHRQKLYLPWAPPAEQLRTTDEVSSQVLCLPLHDRLSEETVGRIAGRVVGLARPTRSKARGAA